MQGVRSVWDGYIFTVNISSSTRIYSMYTSDAQCPVSTENIHLSVSQTLNHPVPCPCWLQRFLKLPRYDHSATTPKSPVDIASLKIHSNHFGSLKLSVAVGRVSGVFDCLTSRSSVPSRWNKTFDW